MVKVQPSPGRESQENRAMVSFYDLFGDDKSKTAATSFGCDKRGKDIGGKGGGQSTAVIGNGDM